MLFASLTCFTYSFNPIFFDGRESSDDSFRLHSLEFLEIDVADSLMPQLYVCVDFVTFGIVADFTSFESTINIWPYLRPLATSRPSFSMKQPSWLNQTCMSCSTIWPTETKFFALVGTCKTFLMKVLLHSFLNGTLLTCQI